LDSLDPRERGTGDPHARAGLPRLPGGDAGAGAVVPARLAERTARHVVLADAAAAVAAAAAGDGACGAGTPAAARTASAAGHRLARGSLTRRSPRAARALPAPRKGNGRGIAAAVSVDQAERAAQGRRS